MNGRRQEGERRGAWQENSISILPPPPTGDRTQDLLYLDKSSMTKLYLQITSPFLETGPHYLAHSVPSFAHSSPASAPRTVGTTGMPKALFLNSACGTPRYKYLS